MSGSITIIGGHTGNTLTGLVTVPLDLSASVTSALQILLGSSLPGGSATAGLSDSVLAGQVFLNNTNVVASGPGLGIIGSNSTKLPGLLELTNTYSNGSVAGGSVSGSAVIPANYGTLIVQAPGAETLTGNGADSVLAVFGAQSSVNFNTGGGSGTVVAGGGGDFVVLSGSSWSATGSSDGNDTFNSNAANAFISTYGQGHATGNAIGADSTPSNVVGLAGSNATVNSNGTNDLIETYSGHDIVSVYGSANVLINGGADTVYATAGSTAVKAFFNLFGGTLDFINNSTVAATVSGAVPGASGGSTTAFGGIGGGVYIGGTAGNNSLVGGSGVVTLVGAGTNNYLEAAGFGSTYGTQNVLVAGSGGATLVADSTTGFNQFNGGSGTDSVVSFGKGAQTYYVGSTGSEQFSGSTVSGASNEYVFNQDSTGNGADVITNFRLGTDHIDINLGGGSGVSITGFDSLGGGTAGSIIYLSDRTTIQLYGVDKATLNSSIIGGTHI